MYSTKSPRNQLRDPSIQEDVMESAKKEPLKVEGFRGFKRIQQGWASLKGSI